MRSNYQALAPNNVAEKSTYFTYDVISRFFSINSTETAHGHDPPGSPQAAHAPRRYARLCI